MRLKIPAGFSAPLLLSSLAAILAGCPTGTAQQDSSAAPKVIAVYAIDFLGNAEFSGQLPSVALYLDSSKFQKSDAHVSKTAPASYGALQIEFDQPLKGDSIAPVESLGSGAGPSTACAFNANSPIQLVDVTGGNTVDASSVCYDPSSIIGSNPHVIITIGGSSAPTDVFTCQSFLNSEQFSANNQYLIKFTPASVVGSNGKGMSALPSGTGWDATGFKFNTADLEVLETAYQDASTGYFHIMQKPSGGFFKDLDPEDAATYRQPPTSDAFIVYLSDAVATDNNGNLLTATSHGACDPTADDPDGDCDKIHAGDFCADLTPGATNATPDPAPTGECHSQGWSLVRKKDGSVLPVDADNSGDPRVLNFFPAVRSTSQTTFEPNVEYVLTLSSDLMSGDTGNALGKDFTSDFIAADAPLGPIGTAPASGTTAQSFRQGTPGGVPLQVYYQVPVDATTVNTTNVILTANGQPVTIAPQLGGANKQTVQVFLDPSAGVRLLPSTNYELKISGLKSAAVPQEDAGKTLSPVDVSFTTISFGVSKIYDYLAENLDPASEGNGVGTPGNTAASNQDRSVTVSANELENNRLAVQFNNTAANVSADTLQLFEVGAGSALTQVPASVTKVTDGQHARSYIITANSSYAVKYGQRYVVKALTAITDPNNVNLKAEGCTGTGDACAEIRSFNTATLAPTPGFHIIADTRASHPPGSKRTDPNAKILGLFDINFNYKVDPATLNLPTTDADKTKAVKLFKTDATGALVQVGIACSVASTTLVTCQATAPLDRNTPYTLNVLYSSDAPLIVPASYTTGAGAVINDPDSAQTLTITADTQTGRFSGVRTLSFTSSCP